MYKGYVCCHKYLFMKLYQFNFLNSPCHIDWFAIFLPQIVCAMWIYWTFTWQYMIFWLWKIHMNYLTDGYLCLMYRVFPWSTYLIFLMVNPCFFWRQYLLLPLPHWLDYKNEVHIHAYWITCLGFPYPPYAPWIFDQFYNMSLDIF